jgi:ligand-binding sensor domain-containing protein
MRLYPLVFLFSLLCFDYTKAQLQPVGAWQSHLSYHEATCVVEAGKSTYFSTNLGIVEVANIYEIYFHNKVTGLSDMGISTMAYNRQYNALIIAYQNSNIDVLYQDNDEVVNFPAILNNTNILGAKTINHIYAEGQKVYFSCAFGLVELDMELKEFSKSTFTTRNTVWASSSFANSLFVSTQNGIFEGKKDGRNLQDFNQWIFHGSNLNLYNNYSSNALMALGSRLYADINDTLMVYNGNNWAHIPTIDSRNNTNINKTVCTPYIIAHINTNFNRDRLILSSNSNTYFELDTNYTLLNQNFLFDVFNIKSYASDTFGNQWVPTSKGMLKRNFEGDRFFIPNSPAYDKVQSMSVDNQGTLWIAGATLDYTNYFFDITGFYSYKGGEWANYNNTTRPVLDTFQDAVVVACNPRRNETFIGSFMNGITHLRGDSIIAIYNQRNTINGLQPVVGDTPRTRVTGMKFDNNNNCWITNSLSINSIVLRKADGSWQNFNSPFSGRLGGIDIDRNGYKWIIQESGNLFVFSEGVLNNPNDDKYLQISASNSELASSNVNCVTADLDGTIWVGTTNGVTIFSCGTNLFEDGCKGSRPVVNPDNFNGRLLEAENVKTIAIDGNNRKWIGTDNGVFVLSADGYERVYFFNESNSPLFDNSINKIAIDGKTGLVFISTTKGLLSYRSDATAGVKIADDKAAYVFPNPVKNDYEGVISITNLPTDANVKITDINGFLMYETYALGGQASWNGRDYNGRKAQSGVYLVFVVSEDGQQKLATKLLFLN